MDLKTLTTQETAALAGVSHRTVKRWARAGRLRITRDVLSGRVSYAREDVERVIRARADVGRLPARGTKRAARVFGDAG